MRIWKVTLVENGVKNIRFFALKTKAEDAARPTHGHVEPFDVKPSKRGLEETLNLVLGM